MSTITRAFTTRRVKMTTDIASARDAPQRSNTTKGMGNPSIRHKISAPLELIHTTNMLSYNAPDIQPLKQATSPSSSSSKSDSDSDSTATAASSPPTSPEVSPAERSMSPEPNHLSCYFTPPGQALTTPGAGVVEAPTIPKRAPSHTKKASYEALARSRSNSALNSRMSSQSSRTVSTKASFTFSTGSRVSSTSTSASSVSHATTPSYSQKPAPPPMVPAVYQPTTQKSRQEAPAPPPESHPFGHELAQVTEIAEEYGVTEKLQILDEEEKELRRKGLKKFSAEDYLNEVQALINSFFYDAPPVRHARPVAAVWI